MKICMFCITYNRPALLPRMIESFQRQTHPDRELLILDDAGQYNNQKGDRWEIVSVNRRFLTMGEKRNAAMSLASADVDGYLTTDDDDVYLPHTLEAVNDALERGHWAQPRQILEFNPDGSFKRCETFHRQHPGVFAYHGSFAYRRSALIQVNGYPWCHDEEYGLCRELKEKFGPSIDSTEKFKPWYVYDRHSNVSHFSTAGCDDNAYVKRGQEPVRRVYNVVPAWDRDYAAISIPDQVQPRVW